MEEKIDWERPYMQAVETQTRDRWAEELISLPNNGEIKYIRSGDRIVVRSGSQVFDCLITGIFRPKKTK